MKYFSMFSGIGGFDLALNRLNHECIGYSEIDKYSIQTYQKNFGTEVKNYGNATTINPNELPDFDLLCGGFPCQAFSIAGKRRGFEDTRGTLFFEIARIIKVKRPKIIFLENVKGLLNHNKGETFATIIQTLSKLGYDVQWMVLNSKFFGVPQNRERVFIIGNIRGEPRPEILPITGTIGKVNELIQINDPTHSNNRVYNPEGLSPALNTMQGGNRQPIIYDDYNHKIKKDGICGSVRPTFANKATGNGCKIVTHSLFPRSSKTNKDGTGHLTKEDETAYCLDSGNCQAIAIPVLTPDRLKKRQNGRRFKENGEESFTLTGQDKHGIMVANCLDANYHKGISVNKDRHTPRITINECFKIRKLTPTECERLQGFPDGWTEGVSDTQRYKQLGNAVTVNVVYEIAKRFPQ